MTTDWDEVSYVVSSRYRVVVLEHLADNPAIPSQIVDETGQDFSSVSRALGNLRSRGLVELLVPETRKKGRVYGITGKGTRVWNRIEEENLA